MNGEKSESTPSLDLLVGDEFVGRGVGNYATFRVLVEILL